MRGTKDDPINQGMTKIQYEPDELMVRYLEAILLRQPDPPFADLHIAAARAHEVVGPLVDEDVTTEKLLNWVEEARRRIAWRNRTR